MGVDLSQFHATFFEESFEGLDIMEASLLELDPDVEPDAEQINTIFRAAHSIKGGSGTFGFGEISTFTHTLETVLDRIRSHEILISPSIISTLLEAVDSTRDMILAEKNSSHFNSQQADGIRVKLEAILCGKEMESAEISEGPVSEQDVDEQNEDGWLIRFAPEPQILKTGNDPLRIMRELSTFGSMVVEVNTRQLPDFTELDPECCFLSWDISLRGAIDKEQILEVFEWVMDDCKLEIIPLQTIPDKQPVVDDAKNHQDLPEAESPGAAVTMPVSTGPAQPGKDASVMVGNDKPVIHAGDTTASQQAKRKNENSSIRVGTDKVDELINLVGELVITQSMLCQIAQDFDSSKIDRLQAGLAQLERHTRELQDSALRIRMLPISFTFNRFPRLVHDLGNKLGKKIELKISGEGTELDKTVMEKIGDPLVHLVRNSIDHGLETPEVRRAAGKSETGVLHLNAFHKGGNIIIEISDDGAGLDRDKIRSRAIDKGLLNADEKISDDRIHELIFEPGFSTADQVSDVSGRGVGMDVVRRNIRELGGAVEISSEAGKGSTISIRLPLTLAIMDGQLVRVGDEIFVIPMVSIIETIEAKPASMKRIFDDVEVYHLRDEYISIIGLHELFNIKPFMNSKNLLVILEGENSKIGVHVDELLGQQQVVIKSLETNYRRIDGISGATILGDGTVAMILDVSDLMMMSKQRQARINAHRVA